MRKIIAMALMMLVVVGALFGCSTRSAQAPVPTTVAPTQSTQSSQEGTATDDSAGYVNEGMTANTEETIPPLVVEESEKSAYLDVIEEYEQTYGQLHNYDDDAMGFIYGVCVAKLMDFDGDGVNELLLVYREKDSGAFESKVWTMDGDKALEVRNSNIVSNDGTSVQPYIDFYYKDNKVYVRGYECVWGTPVFNEYQFITLFGDEMKAEKTFSYCLLEDGRSTDTCVDGEAVSISEFSEEYAPYNADLHPNMYQMFDLCVWDEEDYQYFCDSLQETKDILG